MSTVVYLSANSLGTNSVWIERDNNRSTCNFTFSLYTFKLKLTIIRFYDLLLSNLFISDSRILRHIKLQKSSHLWMSSTFNICQRYQNVLLPKKLLLSDSTELPVRICSIKIAFDLQSDLFQKHDEHMH